MALKLTLIARVLDGLPLAEGLETEKGADMEVYKQQAKTLLKKLAVGPGGNSLRPMRASYLTDTGVCYLTLAEKSYPKQLAFQYVEELQREFSANFGTQIATVARPYAFIKFDTFISKTRKLYLDSRTQRNLGKLSADLAEVHTIMTRNIAEVLGQGERLAHMTTMSSSLSAESKKYAGKAAGLARAAALRKYVPFGVVAIVVLGLLWLRSRFM